MRRKTLRMTVFGTIIALAGASFGGCAAGARRLVGDVVAKFDADTPADVAEWLEWEKWTHEERTQAERVLELLYNAAARYNDGQVELGD